MISNLEYVKYGYLTKEEPDYGDIGTAKKAFLEIGRTSQIEWMIKELEYLRIAREYELRYDLKRGEIYEIDFGLNVNSEFSNRHYGVVLVDSKPNNPLCLVCPLKTNHTGGHIRSDVDIGIVEGLANNVSTLAIINQIRTIDKFRILRRSRIGLKHLNPSIYERKAYIDRVSIPRVYRLNEKQLKMIICAYLNFVEFNGVTRIGDE